MKIEFNKIDAERVEKLRGGVGDTFVKAFDDSSNRIMRLSLPVGSSIGLHRHTNDSETVYIISGQGKNICDGVEEILHEGDVHYCKKGSEHTLINTGSTPLEIFAVIPKQ